MPATYFSFDDPDPIFAYVESNGLLTGTPGDFSLKRPGEGNMNFVARISSGDRSVILKQSRPWVEKYPSIEAPEKRILTEIAFFERTATIPALQSRMPRMVHSDPQNLVAVFEDLGSASDYTTLYERDTPAPAEELAALLTWLSALHEGLDAPPDTRIRNRDMRALNHAHIFAIPLDPDNGLNLDDITPGLATAAGQLQSDPAYSNAVAELGHIYLSDGDTLLHGDFYPGSWVRSTDGPKVIDPEFAFHGRPEFDTGVCRAHLLLAGMSAEQVDAAFTAYTPTARLDSSLVDGFTGVEIMRRLIGVAQLPLERSLTEKETLLSLSRRLVLGPGG